jgi:hypothetical protein
MRNNKFSPPLATQNPPTGKKYEKEKECSPAEPGLYVNIRIWIWEASTSWSGDADYDF